MDTAQKTAIIVAGAVLLAAGLLLLIFKPGSTGQSIEIERNKIKFLGLEFDLSSPWLAIIGIGAVLIVAPLFAGPRNTPDRGDASAKDTLGTALPTDQPLAADSSKPTGGGCLPKVFQSGASGNDQSFEFPGGDCGGHVNFTAHFDGVSGTPSPDSGLPSPENWRAGESVELLITDQSLNSILCRKTDARFDRFHLACDVKFDVPVRTTKIVSLSYNHDGVDPASFKISNSIAYIPNNRK